MGNKIIKLTEKEIDSIITTLKAIDVRGFESMDRLVGLVLFFKGKQTTMEEEQAVGENNNGIN